MPTLDEVVNNSYNDIFKDTDKPTDTPAPEPVKKKLSAVDEVVNNSYNDVFKDIPTTTAPTSITPEKPPVSAPTPEKKDRWTPINLLKHTPAYKLAQTAPLLYKKYTEEPPPAEPPTFEELQKNPPKLSGNTTFESDFPKEHRLLNPTPEMIEEKADRQQKSLTLAKGLGIPTENIPLLETPEDLPPLSPTRQALQLKDRYDTFTDNEFVKSLKTYEMPATPEENTLQLETFAKEGLEDYANQDMVNKGIMLAHGAVPPAMSDYLKSLYALELKRKFYSSRQGIVKKLPPVFAKELEEELKTGNMWAVDFLDPTSPQGNLGLILMIAATGPATLKTHIPGMLSRFGIRMGIGGVEGALREYLIGGDFKDIVHGGALSGSFYGILGAGADKLAKPGVSGAMTPGQRQELKKQVEGLLDKLSREVDDEVVVATRQGQQIDAKDASKLYAKPEPLKYTANPFKSHSTPPPEKVTGVVKKSDNLEAQKKLDEIHDSVVRTPQDIQDIENMRFALDEIGISPQARQTFEDIIEKIPYTHRPTALADLPPVEVSEGITKWGNLLNYYKAKAGEAIPFEKSKKILQNKVKLPSSPLNVKGIFKKPVAKEHRPKQVPTSNVKDAYTVTKGNDVVGITADTRAGRSAITQEAHEEAKEITNRYKGGVLGRLSESFATEFYAHGTPLKEYMRRLVREKGPNSEAAAEFLDDFVLTSGARSSAGFKLKNYINEIQVKKLTKPEEEVFNKIVSERSHLAHLARLGARADGGDPKAFDLLKKVEASRPKITKLNHESYMEEISEKLPPSSFNKIMYSVEKVFEIQKRELRGLYEAGLIKPEVYNDLSPYDYSRAVVIDHIDPLKQFRLDGSELANVTPALARLKGYTGKAPLEYREKPIVSLQETVVAAENRKLFNNANTSLARVLQQNPERVKDILEPVEEVIYPIQKQLDGYTEELGYWIPHGYKPVRYWENGQSNVFAMKEAYYTMYTRSPLQMIPTTASIISHASGASLLRAMATGINPGFAIKNFTRDAMFQWLTTESRSPYVWKAIPQYVDDVKAVASDVRNEKGIYKTWVEAGGVPQMYYNYGTEYLPGTNKAIELLQLAGKFSEELNRVAFFRRELINAEALGYEGERAVKYAAAASKNLLDFGDGGRVIKFLDLFLPYLNVATQVTRASARHIKDRPLQAAMKYSQLAAMAAAFHTYQRAAFGHAYSRISAHDKATGINIILPGEQRDHDNNPYYNHIKFYTDGVGALVWNFTTLVADEVMGYDVSDGWDILGQSADQALPFIDRLEKLDIPARSFIQGLKGYDTYRERKIGGFKNVSSEYKVEDRTHQFFRDTAPMVGLSPGNVQVAMESLLTSDHPLFSTFGFLYNMFDPLPDHLKGPYSKTLIEKTPIFNSVFHSAKPISFDYTADFDKRQKKENDLYAQGKLEINTLIDNNVSYDDAIETINSFTENIDIKKKLLKYFTKEMSVKSYSQRTLFRTMESEPIEAKAEAYFKHWEYLGNFSNSKKDRQQLAFNARAYGWTGSEFHQALFNYVKTLNEETKRQFIESYQNPVNTPPLQQSPPSSPISVSPPESLPVSPITPLSSPSSNTSFINNVSDKVGGAVNSIGNFITDKAEAYINQRELPPTYPEVGLGDGVNTPLLPEDPSAGFGSRQELAKAKVLMGNYNPYVPRNDDEMTFLQSDFLRTNQEASFLYSDISYHQYGKPSYAQHDLTTALAKYDELWQNYLMELSAHMELLGTDSVQDVFKTDPAYEQRF